MKAISLVIIIAAGALLYIYSGRYNVAATVPHTKLMEWVLIETKEKSIEFHSRDISTPPGLNDPSTIENGSSHYDAMCSGCHGGPGMKPAEGFNPPPPALVETAEGLKPREIFWVVKNGIKMTGMPESGSTHTDDEIWAIAAFVKRLPGMSAQEYNTMKEKADGHTHENGH